MFDHRVRSTAKPKEAVRPSIQCRARRTTLGATSLSPSAIPTTAASRQIIPTFGLQPFAYCSGTAASPSCSTLWYPSDLDRYDLTAINGQDYICEPAFGAGFGDLDCYRYDGGDPMFAVGGLPDQYCSQSGSGVSCDRDDHPSVWEGFYVVTIDFSEYICESTWQGEECYRRYGDESPSDVAWGLPDYYCNDRGCDTNGYP
jgi:hypothetical protein